MVKKILIILSCIFVFTTLYSFSNSFENATTVYAEKSEEVSKKKALDTTGFSEKLDTKFISKFKAINSMIITIGIILCVIFLVVGGITLAASNGNPQKRSIGITAIICACVGVYIVYKSRMIAGWVIAV